MKINFIKDGHKVDNIIIRPQITLLHTIITDIKSSHEYWICWSQIRIYWSFISNLVFIHKSVFTPEHKKIWPQKWKFTILIRNNFFNFPDGTLDKFVALALSRTRESKLNKSHFPGIFFNVMSSLPDRVSDFLILLHRVALRYSRQ